MNNEYVTLKQIAEWQQVTVQTVRNWIKNGHLKAVKIGKSYKVNFKDYKTLCEKGI